MEIKPLQPPRMGFGAGLSFTMNSMKSGTLASEHCLMYHLRDDDIGQYRDGFHLMLVKEFLGHQLVVITPTQRECGRW